VIELFEKERTIHGVEAYRYISKILREAKELHKQHFQATGKMDHEQSWRAFKGKNLEKLLTHILFKEVETFGLKIISGNALGSSHLQPLLDRVKRNLIVDYGQYGMHLPDVDLVIIDPVDACVLSAISVKVTLRERVAQTGYWKLKLSNSATTRNIKVYFVTLDEDGTLMQRSPAKKGRAIVETDTDGGYILSENSVQESEHVKMFDKFILDLKTLYEDSKRARIKEKDKPFS
jgi:type II restriction enzyme